MLRTSTQRIGFQEIDYSFDVGALLADSRAHLKAREMPCADLRALVARFDRRRGAERRPAHEACRLPARAGEKARVARGATILFALVGVPLGLRRARGARSWGALLCIAVVFGYYAILSLSQYLGGAGVVSPPGGALDAEPGLRRVAAVLLYRARSRSV